MKPECEDVSDDVLLQAFTQEELIDAYQEAEKRNLRLETLVACMKVALIKARETIYAFHGEPAWKLYQQSPEMRAINRAIEAARAIYDEGGEQ